MTDIRVGIVDVYVIRPYRADWLVLSLQRSGDTRCPGSWETIHGRIEPNERPEQAAVREVREETALELDRLYNVTCQPFYLHTLGVVQMAVVFAAFGRHAGTWLQSAQPRESRCPSADRLMDGESKPDVETAQERLDSTSNNNSV